MNTQTRKRAVRVYANIFVARIQSIFQEVKKANKKYRNILLEFQDALKTVARWSDDDKDGLLAETENQYMYATADVVYDAFLDVVRAVWREAYLLNDRVTPIELQKNLSRLEAICMKCAEDVVDSSIANAVLNPYTVHHKQQQQAYKEVSEDESSEDEEDTDSESSYEDEEGEGVEVNESGSDDEEDDQTATQIEASESEEDDYVAVEHPEDNIKTVSIGEPEVDPELDTVETSEESDYEQLSDSASDEEQESTATPQLSIEKPEQMPSAPIKPASARPSIEQDREEDIKVVTINDRLLKQKNAVKKKLLHNRHHNPASFF